MLCLQYGKVTVPHMHRSGGNDINWYYPVLSLYTITAQNPWFTIS